MGETINVYVNNGMGALIYIIQLSRGKENVADAVIKVIAGACE